MRTFEGIFHDTLQLYVLSTSCKQTPWNARLACSATYPTVSELEIFSFWVSCFFLLFFLNLLQKFKDDYFHRCRNSQSLNALSSVFFLDYFRDHVNFFVLICKSVLYNFWRCSCLYVFPYIFVLAVYFFLLRTAVSGQINFLSGAKQHTRTLRVLSADLVRRRSK